MKTGIPVPRIPATKSDWASLMLGISLIFFAIAHFLQGNPNQAFVDLSGALGTLGLPSLMGSGWHIEVRKDFPE